MTLVEGLYYTISLENDYHHGYDQKAIADNKKISNRELSIGS